MRAPRRIACSRSSSTRMPAPSAITKPSRSRSNGRDACSGSRRDGGERAERAVAGDDHGGERRVGTTGEHRIGAVLADQRERGADRVRARGACRAGRGRGAAQAEGARRRGRGDVGERERDRERADAVGAALVVRLVGVGERLRASVGRADRRADAAGRKVEIAAGVLEREPWPPRRRAGRSDPCGAHHAARTRSRGRSPRSGRARRERLRGTRSGGRRCGRPRANPRTPGRRCPSGRAHRDQ